MSIMPGEKKYFTYSETAEQMIYLFYYFLWIIIIILFYFFIIFLFIYLFIHLHVHLLNCRKWKEFNTF